MPTQRQRVRKHQYDSLACMLLLGWDTKEIARILDVKPELVAKYGRGDGPKEFQDLHARYRGKMCTGVIESGFRFIDMMTPSIDTIERALGSKDERLAVETAKWVVNRVAPLEDKRAPGAGVSLRVDMSHNTQVNTQLVDMTGGILETLQGLKERPATDFGRHLKVGTEALPAAVQASLGSGGNGSGEPEEGLGEEPEVVDVEEGAPRLGEEQSGP